MYICLTREREHNIYPCKSKRNVGEDRKIVSLASKATILPSIRNTVKDYWVDSILLYCPGTLARGSATLFDRGYSDYKYDELWLGRNSDGGTG